MLDDKKYRIIKVDQSNGETWHRVEVKLTESYWFPLENQLTLSGAMKVLNVWKSKFGKSKYETIETVVYEE